MRLSSFFIFHFSLRFLLRYQAENIKVKVLKAYPIDGKFHYDVRSIHSWGLPRRGVPENRLKGNAAGFSAFGSLEIFKNRAMCSIGVICVVI